MVKGLKLGLIWKQTTSRNLKQIKIEFVAVVSPQLTVIFVINPAVSNILYPMVYFCLNFNLWFMLNLIWSRDKSVYWHQARITLYTETMCDWPLNLLCDSMTILNHARTSYVKSATLHHRSLFEVPMPWVNSYSVWLVQFAISVFWSFTISLHTKILAHAMLFEYADF